MEQMSNKALIIAVSLIVTMTIASSILYTINQVKQLYKQVYETNTSIQSSFDEFSAYDGGVKTYLDFENTIRKYCTSDYVFVIYGVTKDRIPYIVNTEGEIEEFVRSQRLKNVEFVKNNSLFKEVNGSIKLKDGINEENPQIKVKYNTYVERLDDGRVIIFFEQI
jgi:hypothetical protein